jgi:hypothetical protein
VTTRCETASESSAVICSVKPRSALHLVRNGDLVDRDTPVPNWRSTMLLVVLRPDGREAGDGARCRSPPPDGRRALQHPAAADAAIRFPSHLVFPP